VAGYTSKYFRWFKYQDALWKNCGC
jgi:hypothetical protein